MNVISESIKCFIFQVFIEKLAMEDLLFITKALYPQIPAEILEKMISFNEQVIKGPL